MVSLHEHHRHGGGARPGEGRGPANDVFISSTLVT